MTTVEITLPDALASDAASLGLLAPERMEAMLRQQLRIEAGKQLREIRERGNDDPMPPMSEEEIRIEIDAYRAEKRQRAAGR